MTNLSKSNERDYQSLAQVNEFIKQVQKSYGKLASQKLTLEQALDLNKELGFNITVPAIPRTHKYKYKDFVQVKDFENPMLIIGRYHYKDGGCGYEITFPYEPLFKDKEPHYIYENDILHLAPPAEYLVYVVPANGYNRQQQAVIDKIKKLADEMNFDWREYWNSKSRFNKNFNPDFVKEFNSLCKEHSLPPINYQGWCIGLLNPHHFHDDKFATNHNFNDGQWVNQKILKMLGLNDYTQINLNNPNHLDVVQFQLAFENEIAFRDWANTLYHWLRNVAYK